MEQCPNSTPRAPDGSKDARAQVTPSITFREPRRDTAPGSDSWHDANPSAFARVEIAILGIFFLVLLAAKLFANFHYRIDSDEPQHAHVVWSWLHGQVAYRDFFDNHAPLFHLCCVPLLWLLGEHSRTLLLLRLTSVVAYAGCLLSVWRLLIPLTSWRLAAWTALVLGCFPPFFLTSTEFRPDILWALLWLASLATLVASQGRPAEVGKAFFILGAAFSVSLKSVLMLVAMGVPLLIWFCAGGRSTRAIFGARWRGVILAAMGGFAVAPALLGVYFCYQGALRDAYQCTIQHNLLPGEHTTARTLIRALQWALGMAVPVTLCVKAWRNGECRPPNQRLIFLWLVAATFLVTLRSFWRFLTPEDYLPLYALAVPLGTLAFFGQMPGRHRPGLGRVVMPGVLAAGLLTLSCWQGRILQNSTHRKLHLVADVLRLTEPGTIVMDAKGETMFRERASRLVMEHLTNLRVKKGLLTDDIAEQLVKERVPVVSDSKLTTKAQLFTGRFYVSVAWRVRVLGQRLQPTPILSGSECRFETIIPAAYALVDPTGLVRGTVDGQPNFGAAVYLRPGMHVFRCETHPGPIAYEWSRALQKGFSPFSNIPVDRRRPED